MRKITDHRLTDRFVATAVIVATCMGWTGAASAADTVRLDAGSVIPVHLNDTIGSARSLVGDTFTASVTLARSEDCRLPYGTKVDGVVTGVQPRRDNYPGVIEVKFNRVRLPDGHSYPIDASLIGLDNRSVERRPDGLLVARPTHRNDRLTYAGYGAGAGLIVSVLTHRPIEDALLGSLLGYGIGSLQRRISDARDVVLRPGTSLGVRIDHATSLTSFEDTPDSTYRRDPPPIRYHVTMDANGYAHEYTRQGQTEDPGTTDSAAEIGVMIDDRDVPFDTGVRPFVTADDVILVPAIPVLRDARIPYKYDPRLRVLRAMGSGESVRITTGSSIAVVSGLRRVRMEAPVQRINGTLYVPLTFLSIATGYETHYDSGSRTVVLTSR